MQCQKVQRASSHASQVREDQVFATPTGPMVTAILILAPPASRNRRLHAPETTCGSAESHILSAPGLTDMWTSATLRRNVAIAPMTIHTLRVLALGMNVKMPARNRWYFNPLNKSAAIIGHRAALAIIRLRTIFALPQQIFLTIVMRWQIGNHPIAGPLRS